MKTIHPTKLYGWVACLCLLVIDGHSALLADDAEISRTIEDIRAIGPLGKGYEKAVVAMTSLNREPVSRIPLILQGMDDASPLAQNWLRAAIEAIADHGETIPVAPIEAFLADTSHSPRGRRLAFELLVAADPTARERWIPRFADDPSLELRRDAVEMLVNQADRMSAEAQSDEKVAKLQEALDAARDLDQVEAITKQLKELGEEVDIPVHFGFIRKWFIIGPFDNTDKSGFEVAYAPELKIDLMASVQGKEGEVAWKEATTDDDYGIVDLNEALGKYMGAITYAYVDFVSDQDCDAEVRLGSYNANRVWVNGELVTSNHTYHTAQRIDQYIGKARLKKGSNSILLKICQNEQSESWAQNWQFQMRVTDPSGKALVTAASE